MASLEYCVMTTGGFIVVDVLIQKYVVIISSGKILQNILFI